MTSVLREHTYMKIEYTNRYTKLWFMQFLFLCYKISFIQYFFFLLVFIWSIDSSKNRVPSQPIHWPDCSVSFCVCGFNLHVNLVSISMQHTNKCNICVLFGAFHFMKMGIRFLALPFFNCLYFGLQLVIHVVTLADCIASGNVGGKQLHPISGCVEEAYRKKSNDNNTHTYYSLLLLVKCE